MRTQTAPLTDAPGTQTQVLPVGQQRHPPELVLFDDGDEIEISPRQQQPSKPNSSVDLAQSTRHRELQKIKINHMLESIKRSQQNSTATNVRPHRQSIGLTEEEVPPLLRQQLNNIEQEMIEHREVEKFMISFVKNPEQAIQSLVAKGEIRDDPKQIAGYLVKLNGINKAALGQLFGKNKQRVLAILKDYCRCLNFRGLEFDKAFRVLLSRFKLPGEAQQIQRILKVFSQVYYETHEDEFASADEIHVLSFSLIMLNTDAHNPMQQKKMTKAEFVKNTSPVCPKIPKEYLEGMYDRIVRDKFETETNYIEKIYDRLHMLNLNISVSGIARILNSAVELIKGHIFIKYCRNSVKSVQRKLFLSQKEDQLLWLDPNKPNKEPRFIMLKDIVDLTLGCSSAVMRMNKVPKQFDSMCFSIVTNSRTLDLKARDSETRAKWVNYIGALLIQKRQDLRKSKEAFHRTYYNKDRIEEIWNTDIFPHWDSHWDYRLKRPKHKKYQTFFKAVRKFCCCSGKTTDEVYEVQAGQYDGMFPIKTPLLQTLWKYGLPASSRKTLWPIVIGNALTITPRLYEIYNRRKREIPSIHKMPYSVEAIKLVELLAVIRPDISLVRNLLELAEVFTRYLNEYDAFVALANMMHSHYFLAFFQGDLAEIDFRVKFFDYLIDKNLPLVAAHFHALEISSRLFMVNWFLSLFCSCFAEDEFLARIWDNFFMEGEIYLFKVAVAIIKYYEFELKMSTFEEAVRLLSHPKETSEVLLFDILDTHVHVSQSEYDDYIEKRKFAVIKTRVQEIPLE